MSLIDSKWQKRMKTIAMVNNILAVVALLMAATLIYLYLQWS